MNAFSVLNQRRPTSLRDLMAGGLACGPGRPRNQIDPVQRLALARGPID